MPARYISGAATSSTELLNALVDFLNLQGWGTLAFFNEGAGKRAHLSKNGLYVNLRAANNESTVVSGYNNTGSNNHGPVTGLALNTGTGYSPDSSWLAQPGVPGEMVYSFIKADAAMAKLTGGITFAFHIFDDGADNIFVAAESSTTGTYAYVAFGPAISKIGVWGGGSYFYASTLADRMLFSQNSAQLPGAMFLRADVDGTNGWRSTKSDITRACYTSNGSSGGQYPVLTTLGAAGVSIMSGQANLIPVSVLVPRSGGGVSFLATLPSVFRCDAVGSGFSAGSTYSVGGDHYVLFPNFAVRKFA